jgi:hypothetical protein
VFEWLLTMLAVDVDLDVVAVAHPEGHLVSGQNLLNSDQHQAEQIGRKLKVLDAEPQTGPDIVRFAREGNYNVIVLPWMDESRSLHGPTDSDWATYVLQNSPCSVFLASHPVVPKEVVA